MSERLPYGADTLVIPFTFVPRQRPAPSPKPAPAEREPEPPADT